jgi:hypothetical protein
MMAPVNFVHLAHKPLVREPVPNVEQNQHNKIKADLSGDPELTRNNSYMGYLSKWMVASDQADQIGVSHQDDIPNQG